MTWKKNTWIEKVEYIEALIIFFTVLNMIYDSVSSLLSSNIVQLAFFKHFIQNIWQHSRNSGCSASGSAVFVPFSMSGFASLALPRASNLGKASSVPYLPLSPFVLFGVF